MVLLLVEFVFLLEVSSHQRRAIARRVAAKLIDRAAVIPGAAWCTAQLAPVRSLAAAPARLLEPVIWSEWVFTCERLPIKIRLGIPGIEPGRQLVENLFSVLR
ncbi:hypothetical protein BKK79_38545 (plasmid) [Cupriavidus sp. USMAA2-4]|nr:hypothetical protein BKK79_38545 [Cupriavidus sp. USMAA2-4]